MTFSEHSAFLYTRYKVHYFEWDDESIIFRVSIARFRALQFPQFFFRMENTVSSPLSCHASRKDQEWWGGELKPYEHWVSSFCCGRHFACIVLHRLIISFFFICEHTLLHTLYCYATSRDTNVKHTHTYTEKPGNNRSNESIMRFNVMYSRQIKTLRWLGAKNTKV